VKIDLSPALARLQSMIEGAIALLPNLLIAALIFLLFLLGARLVAAGVRRVLRRRASRGLALVLGRLAQWLLGFVGLLVALSILIPTFRAGDLVQLLGISGVAIGFAFRDILQNFLAGILILLTRPFRIGDQIVFKGFEGTVEDIQTRATYLRTYDGRRAVVPNAELFTQAVLVNTAFAARRTEYDVGIGYGDDVERARELILAAMRSVDGVLAEPAPDVLLLELAPSSVNLRARWWSPSHRADVLEVRDRVITAIKRSLTANGIDLPFPTGVVLFHDQTEETDGDRSRQREGWPPGKGHVPAPRPLGAAFHAAVPAGVRDDRAGGRGDARGSG
jgi:small conductance mechanosensitive channel